MNTYLTIMVTVLVATQLIRITQNAISLYRQERDVKENIGWLKDNKVTKDDFLRQREAYARLVYLLRGKQKYMDYDDVIDVLEKKKWFDGTE